MKYIKICTLSLFITFGFFTLHAYVSAQQSMNCVPPGDLTCAGVSISGDSVSPREYEVGEFAELSATYYWENNSYNVAVRMDIYNNKTGAYMFTALSETRTHLNDPFNLDGEVFTARTDRRHTGATYNLPKGEYKVIFSIDSKESPSGRSAYDQEVDYFTVIPDEDPAEIRVLCRDLENDPIVGGTWEINPGDISGPCGEEGPYRVTAGATYNLDVTSNPAAWILNSISNSQGGSDSMYLFANDEESFYLTWQRPDVVLSECEDGADNDGDGKVDLADLGCDSQDDDDESNVTPPIGEVTATISANPTSILNGGSTTLTWSSTRATSCTSSWAGNKSTSGSQSVSPTSTTDYTITCSNSAGASDSDTVRVTVTNPNDPQSSYQCSDSTDNDGDGDIDMNDPGCSSTTDNDEYNEVSGPILRVAITGTGSVNSTSVGISCPNDCRQTYSNGNKVTLNAVESGGELNQFLGWSGACTGTGSCQVTMTGRFVDVTARFGEETVEATPLRATVVGEGTMTSNPAGINCTADAENSDCRQNYPQGTVVTLTADPDQGQLFTGWSGEACNGSTNLTCQVTVSGRFFDMTANFGEGDSTIRVRSNVTASWTINPGEYRGTTPAGSMTTGVVVVPSTGGTLYTITPGSVSGHGTPTVSNSQTGAGASMMVFPDEGQYFTLNYPAPFNYTLSNSGTVTVRKAGIPQYGQGTVTKNLTSGTAQSIDLTLSGVPSGVTYTSANNPCPPNCTSTITFTVQPSAQAGIHPITVTGSPLGKTTQFNLVIQESPDIVVSCTANPVAPLVGQSVTWTANVSGGGVPPYTYSWSGTNLPVPAPTTQSFNVTYSTVGQKTVQATVRDSLENTGTCSPGGSLYVDFDPSFEEF